MKKAILIFAYTILILSCAENKNQKSEKTGFELNGKLSNSSNEQLYLEQMTAQGIDVIDTATLSEAGEFTFLNANPRPGFYRLRITKANFAMLVLDSSQHVSVTGDARDLGNTFKVEGSPDSKLFWELNETAKRSYQARDSMMRSYEAYANLNKGDAKKIEEFSADAETKFNTEAKRLNNYLLDFINKNSSSLVSMIALQQLMPDYSEDGYAAQYKLVDEALLKKYPHSPQTQSFHQSVVTMFQTAIGAPAPDFTFNTPEGKALSLSSFKGKILLIDFWASWCGPCRAESPNMVKLYKKFHPKGLEILGVSLDEDKNKWIEAIKKDKLEWAQISDLGGWQSAAAKLYGIQSIPQTILLDKEQKIIAKGLRAESLETKLTELFK
ncbi:MAG: AhpC/TSA family protein [Bacteroidia bacterium]|nr:AhpC/TSA family protein [Bacteroidia bacterium]